MTVRGVRASGVNTVTSAVHGQLRHDAASRAEFFTLIGSSEQPTPLLNDKAHP
jgi:GTP cyclohydrolase I